MTELEAQKAGYEDAIELEEARAKALSDEGSIRAQFERFAHANLDDPDVRDAVLEYFVDRIYLHDDRYTVTFKFEDMAEASLTFGEYTEAAEQPPDGEFDCLPCSSTMSVLLPAMGVFLFLAILHGLEPARGEQPGGLFTKERAARRDETQAQRDVSESPTVHQDETTRTRERFILAGTLFSRSKFLVNIDSFLAPMEAWLDVLF